MALSDRYSALCFILALSVPIAIILWFVSDVEIRVSPPSRKGVPILSNTSCCASSIPSEKAVTMSLINVSISMPQSILAVTHGWQSPDPFLFNPLDPAAIRLHHELMRNGTFKQYYGPWERDVLIDWLGIKTSRAHECTSGGDQLFDYMPWVPARRFQCDRHAALVRATGTGCCIAGDMPLFDDEYPEWIDMLNSVVRVGRTRPYVVVELGARLGTWGVRALAARRQLFGPDDVSLFVGLESWPTYVQWMKQHVERNGFTSKSILLEGYADGNHTDSPILAGAKRYSLQSLVNATKLERISFLDLDIQHHELGFLSHRDARTILSERVEHIHVGTHTMAIHVRLRELFETQLRWKKVLDWTWNRQDRCESKVVNSLQADPSCWTSMPLGGPVYIRDGLLGYTNPKWVL